MPHSILRPHRLLGLLILAATCAGCVSIPKLHTQYVGMGDLPVQSGDHDLPPFDPVAALPMMEMSGESIARPAYRLGPQDRVVVSVWGRADLGSQVPVATHDELKASIVGQNGKLTLPFSR